MKFTIHGFSQQKAMDLGLDQDDLLLLRWFVDFKDTNSMVSKVIDNKPYYWIKYSGLLKDLPILKIKKDTVYRRFKKMSTVGVLDHTTVRQGGVYSFYSLGDKYSELLSDYNPNGTDLNPIPYGNKSDTHTDLNPEQKINLLKDSSIKDSFYKDSKKGDEINDNARSSSKEYDVDKELEKYKDKYNLQLQ